ncbi:hypothetical protein OQA88_7778 [Cercophora sp. LCS_1]
MASRQSIVTLARTAHRSGAAALRQQTRCIHATPSTVGLIAATQWCKWAQDTPKPSASHFGSRTVAPVVARRYYSTEKPVPESKIWDFEQISKLIRDSKHNIALVDVREPGELQQTGWIPGAVNIPITSSPDSFHISEDEFEDRFGYPRPAKDTEIILYCKAGVRGRAAAGLAKDAGWGNVGEYPGSWLDWFEKGGKVEH